MKWLMQFSIALAFTLVCDNAFNGGEITVHLYDSTADVRDWIVRSSDGVVSTMTDFRA